LAGTLLFDEKSAKVLPYFGLDCGMLESFTHETKFTLPQKIFCFLSPCKLWSKQVGGWIHFGMKQLRTLNSYQIFKS